MQANTYSLSAVQYLLLQSGLSRDHLACSPPCSANRLLISIYSAYAETNLVLMCNEWHYMSFYVEKSRMCGRVWYYLIKKFWGVKAFEANLHSDEALLCSKKQSLGHCLFFSPAAENKVKMTVKTCCSVPPSKQVISNGMVSCQSYIHDYPGWNQCSVQNAVCVRHACSGICCCCSGAGIREKADFRNSSWKEFP